MSLAEFLVNITSALLSIGALLLILYYINKKALKKAKKMNEELKKLEKEQEKTKQNKNTETQK